MVDIQDYIIPGLENVVRRLSSTGEGSAEEGHTVGERAEILLTEAQK